MSHFKVYGKHSVKTSLTLDIIEIICDYANASIEDYRMYSTKRLSRLGFKYLKCVNCCDLCFFSSLNLSHVYVFRLIPTQSLPVFESFQYHPESYRIGRILSELIVQYALYHSKKITKKSITKAHKFYCHPYKPTRLKTTYLCPKCMSVTSRTHCIIPFHNY